MKLQVKIFIVVILLLIASLLMVIDKLQNKIDLEKLNSFTNIQKFAVKANEPTKEQVNKIIQKVEPQQSESEKDVRKNFYVPASSEEAESTEEYSKSKADNIYIVRNGDTLYSISKKFYNTTKYADKLFEYNKDMIKKPESLRVGTRLKIPDKTILDKKKEIVHK